MADADRCRRACLVVPTLLSRLRSCAVSGVSLSFSTLTRLSFTVYRNSLRTCGARTSISGQTHADCTLRT